MNFQLCHPADRGALPLVRVTTPVDLRETPYPLPQHVEATGDVTFSRSTV
jgi:hypothetical protein